MARRIAVVLREIRDEIAVIDTALEQVTWANFKSNVFMQRGVERSLEVISEAVRHIPDELRALRPEIPWSDIRAIGNRLRHEYWRVDPQILWEGTRHDLTALRIAIEHIIAAIEP